MERIKLYRVIDYARAAFINVFAMCFIMGFVYTIHASFKHSIALSEVWLPAIIFIVSGLVLLIASHINIVGANAMDLRNNYPFAAHCTPKKVILLIVLFLVFSWIGFQMLYTSILTSETLEAGTNYLKENYAYMMELPLQLLPPAVTDRLFVSAELLSATEALESAELKYDNYLYTLVNRQVEAVVSLLLSSICFTLLRVRMDYRTTLSNIEGSK